MIGRGDTQRIQDLARTVTAAAGLEGHNVRFTIKSADTATGECLRCGRPVVIGNDDGLLRVITRIDGLCTARPSDA